MFGEASRYPDVPSDDLKHAIAHHLNVAPENVLIGCGSGEILRMAVYAFTAPDRALVTGAPSFEDPVKHAEMTHAPVRAVPVDGQLRLDVGRMLDETAGAGLVFLCNPNNPTATVHGAATVRDFIAQTNKRAPDCVVMVDEAYHEYVDDPTYSTAVPLALENPKVIAVRTFSKVFGMAGLRCGYAIGRPETLKQMQRHRLPNNLNVLAAAWIVADAAGVVGGTVPLRPERIRSYSELAKLLKQHQPRYYAGFRTGLGGIAQNAAAGTPAASSDAASPGDSTITCKPQGRSLRAAVRSKPASRARCVSSSQRRA